MALTAFLSSLGSGSLVLAVATCAGGVSGGIVCDESVNAALAIDSGSSGAAGVMVVIAAMSARLTAALAIALGCGAFATAASAVRDGGGRSTIGAAAEFLVPAEPRPASQATTHPARTTVNAATVANRRGSTIAASKHSIGARLNSQTCDFLVNDICNRKFFLAGQPMSRGAPPTPPSLPPPPLRFMPPTSTATSPSLHRLP